MKSSVKNKLLIIFVVAAATAGASVPSGALENGSAPTDTLKSVSPDSLLTPAERNSFNYVFLEALCQKNAGNSDSAASLFKRCLEIDSDAAEAHYEMALYNIQNDKDTLALKNFKRAAELDEGNAIYHESVAQYYLQSRDYPKAIDAYENLYRNNHGRTDVLSLLMQLYEQQKNYPKVLESINRLEKLEGTSEELTLSKMHVYELMNDKKSAYKTISNLADSHPNDITYQIMKGNWLLQNGKPKDAYKIFISALNDNHDNTYAQSSMYDYYKAVGDTSNANIMRDRILLSGKTPSKTKLTVFQQVITENEQQGGDSTKVLNLFDKVINANPKDADLRQMLVAYMTIKKMPEDTIATTLKQIIAVAPDVASARIQLLQMMWPKKDWDGIINMCKPAVQYNPDEMAFYYFMGLAYYQKDDEDNALDAFRRGVGEINSQSNPAIVSDFYALMGDILQKKGLMKQAYAAYDSCLQWKEDNASCLNNYAYFLSVEDTLLDKAEKMSFKTIKAEPTNSTYLDTYAWILFRQRRYSEALIYIDQALKSDTDTIVSGVVLEHAGDINASLGDEKKALTYWLQAQKNGGASELLADKIKQAQQNVATEQKKKRK